MEQKKDTLSYFELKDVQDFFSWAANDLEQNFSDDSPKTEDEFKARLIKMFNETEDYNDEFRERAKRDSSFEGFVSTATEFHFTRMQQKIEAHNNFLIRRAVREKLKGIQGLIDTKMEAITDANGKNPSMSFARFREEIKQEIIDTYGHEWLNTSVVVSMINAVLHNWYVSNSSLVASSTYTVKTTKS